jgi:DNA-binding HxlR family transcriptional regulator
MKPVQKRSNCPIAYSLDYLGDKWLLVVLRDIILHNKSSYGEFLASEEKIATNILADRLTALEQNGFIESSVSPDKKNKFIYSLTEKGIDLVPLVMELLLWGSKYNPPGAVNVVKELEDDKEGTIQRYKDKLKERMKPRAQA